MANQASFSVLVGERVRPVLDSELFAVTIKDDTHFDCNDQRLTFENSAFEIDINQQELCDQTAAPSSKNFEEGFK